MCERPIVPQETPQENIQLMELIIQSLLEGDVITAADEYARAVNNVLEWYSMYFSPEVIRIQDDMFWSEENADNLYWGTGKSFVKADVEAATRSLILRYEEVNGDFSEEIAVYKAAVEAQRAVLADLFDGEIQAVLELSAMLSVE